MRLAGTAVAVLKRKCVVPKNDSHGKQSGWTDGSSDTIGERAFPRMLVVICSRLFWGFDILKSGGRVSSLVFKDLTAPNLRDRSHIKSSEE